MMRTVLWVVSLLIAFTLQSVGAGELYRWVDAEGNVSFSDRPQHEIPKQIVGREDVRKAKAALRAAERQRRADEEAQQIAEIEREYSARNRAAGAASEASCSEAREILESYKTAGLLYTDSANGGYRVMRLKERQALVEELAHDIKSYCSS